MLAVLAHKLKDRLLPGDITLGYVIGYPLGRFFIEEYFRPDAWMIGPLAAAQLFAIICILLAAALLIVRHVSARRTASLPKPEEIAVPPEPATKPPEAAAEPEAEAED